MTDPVAIAIIGAIAGVPATVCGALAAWLSYKSSTHAQEAAETAKAVEKSTDGMKTQLVDLTARSSHAEGVLDEKTRAEGESAHVERAATTRAPGSGEAKP